LNIWGVAGRDRGGVPYSGRSLCISGIYICIRAILAANMSWKDAILDEYWQHLWTKHRFDERFDINLEIQIAKDWVYHGCEMADGSIITLYCDHIKCNHKQMYHVMYQVTPMEEEE
jgi:hypothetical protein